MLTTHLSSAEVENKWSYTSTSPAISLPSTSQAGRRSRVSGHANFVCVCVRACVLYAVAGSPSAGTGRHL